MGKKKAESAESVATELDRVLAGDVERVRITYDARQQGVARASATVHLMGEDNSVAFYGDDVATVAQWLGEHGVAETESAEETGESEETE